MPEVKTFVKGEGHADSYSDISINYIPGHKPDLVLFDAEDVEVERIPLSGYTTDGLHELMVSKGFARSEL